MFQAVQDFRGNHPKRLWGFQAESAVAQSSRRSKELTPSPEASDFAKATSGHDGSTGWRTGAMKDKMACAARVFVKRRRARQVRRLRNCGSSLT